MNDFLNAAGGIGLRLKKLGNDCKQLSVGCDSGDWSTYGRGSGQCGKKYSKCICNVYSNYDVRIFFLLLTESGLLELFVRLRQSLLCSSLIEFMTD